MSHGELVADPACTRLRKRNITDGYIAVYDLKAKFCSIMVGDDIMKSANEISNITSCNECKDNSFTIDKVIVYDIKQEAQNEP